MWCHLDFLSLNSFHIGFIFVTCTNISTSIPEQYIQFCNRIFSYETVLRILFSTCLMQFLNSKLLWQIIVHLSIIANNSDLSSLQTTYEWDWSMWSLPGLWWAIHFFFLIFFYCLDTSRWNLKHILGFLQQNHFLQQESCISMKSSHTLYFSDMNTVFMWENGYWSKSKG